MSIDDIIVENERRISASNALFNPITGEGSTGVRTEVIVGGLPPARLWLPVAMLDVPFVKKLVRAKSVDAFLKSIRAEVNDIERGKVVELFIRTRCQYDFPFWAAAYVFIKAKGGGEDILFRLNRPQRKLIELFESMRTAGKPIRVVMLKARQWGGSTVTQIYMAWLQLVHQTGLNSLIVGHVKDASTEVKDMFDRMISQYPTWMLHELSESYDDGEAKLVGVGKSTNIQRIPQRNCKIKIGTAEKPDSARGGDYNLVHLTEVGLWRTTEGKTPEQIVRSACSGVLLQPYTMIVYESTANGTGNFFQREYDAAKQGVSQFSPIFIPWYEIEQYAIPLPDDDPVPYAATASQPQSSIRSFAAALLENRDNDNIPNNRREPGKYLWWLWEKGATLQAIAWYVAERSKYTDHGDMASEYPSDDIEAFVHSGARVFDRYKVEQFKPACRPPRYVGDVYADADTGEQALENVRFKADKQGLLWVWAMPDIPCGKADRGECGNVKDCWWGCPRREPAQEIVTDRYLVVVDIGGRSHKADWSVIVVFDRMFMMEGGNPTVVAQWYGHIDIDLLAWKAAQIAAYYDNALLVIESNTLETHDTDRQVDGDQSLYILTQIKYVYPNLYARKQSEEDIREGRPRKYGFHTNVKTKPVIISNLVKVIREQLYVERDERCLDEYLTYEKKPNGSFGAIPGKHDDLLMTRAIGLHVCYSEMELPTIQHPRTATRRTAPITEATI
jgi:hypothetical protein